MNITESIIKRLGAKYMPPNAVHFSDLDTERQNAMLQRAPILKEKHFDWLVFKIPRTWTTWWVPFPPMAARGDAEFVPWMFDENGAPITNVDDTLRLHFYCKPIPEPGHWFENSGRTEDIVGYHADTSLDGDINRKGARWDDVDAYMTWPSYRAGSITSFIAELLS